MAFWQVNHNADGHQISPEEPKVNERIYDQIKDNDRYCHCWGPSGELFCGTTGGYLLSFNSIFDSGVLIELEESIEPIHSLCISKYHLILGLDDGLMRLYSLYKLLPRGSGSYSSRSQRQALLHDALHCQTPVSDVSDAEIFHVCMSGDFSRIITGAADGSLYCIKLDRYEQPVDDSTDFKNSNLEINNLVDSHIGTITGMAHLPVSSDSNLSFSHNLTDKSALLVTCGQDGSLRCWNYRTNQILVKKQFETRFTSLTCAPEGRTVFLGSDTGYLRIVTLESEDSDDTSLRPHLLYCRRVRKSPITHMTLGGDNDTLLAMTFEDNHIALMRVNIQSTQSTEDNDFEMSNSKDFGEESRFVLVGFMKFSSRVTALAWTQQHELYVATESSELYLLEPPQTAPSDSVDFEFDTIHFVQTVWKLDNPSHGLIISVDNPKHVFSIADDKSLKYYQLIPGQLSRSSGVSPSSEVESHLKIANSIAVSLNHRYIATGGKDGVVWVRKTSVNLDEQMNILRENTQCGEARFFCSHDPGTGGVSSICFSPDHNFLFSSGCDGTVCVYSLRDSVRFDVPTFQRSYEVTDPRTDEEEKLLSIHEDPSDLTIVEDERLHQDKVQRVLNESEKETLRMRIAELQEEFESLKQENDDLPDEEKLGDDEFIIDHQYLKLMEEATRGKVQQLERETKLDNYRKEILANRIKEECWDSMETHGIVLNSFNYENSRIGQSNDQPKPVKVANFVIRKADPQDEKMIQKIRFLRRVEEVTLRSRRKECVTGNLEGGVPTDDLAEDEQFKSSTISVASSGKMRMSIDARSEVSQASDNEDDLMPYDDRNQGYYERDVTSRVSHNQRKFETLAQTRERVMKALETEDINLKYDPLDLYTRHRKITQIKLIQSEIRGVMIEFNKKFDLTKEQKAKVVQKIRQIDDKIIEIIAELNKTQKSDHSVSGFIYEPKAPKSETPETILSVTNEDMPFKERYISPEELAKREEERRLELERLMKEQAGNASERALMMMMDGRLDTDDNSIDEFEVVPPVCYTKDEKDLTEADMKEIQEYELKKKHKEEEREKHIKQLEARLQNSQLQIRDLCMNFDRSLQTLFQEKLTVDETIFKMELTIIKLAQSIVYQEEAHATEVQLQNIVNELKTKKAQSASSLQEYKKKMELFANECKQLVTDDKNFEENFKLDLAKLIATASAQHMLFDLSQPVVSSQQPFMSPRTAAAQAPNTHRDNNTNRETTNPKQFPSEKEILDRLYKMFKNRLRVKPQVALNAEVASRTEGMKDPFAEVDIARELKQSALQDVLDYHADKPPYLSQYVWDEFWKMRQVKVNSDREIREAKQRQEVMAQQLERMKREDEKLNNIMTVNMTDLNSFRAKIIRESYNLDKLFTFKQGQVEVEQAAVVTDYSDAILINKNIIQNYNQSIRAHAQENIKQMHKSKEVMKKIKKTEWENELIHFETEDMHLKHTELQMTKVTKKMQELIKGGSSEEQKAIEQNRLRNQIEHTKSNLLSKIEEKKRQLRKIDVQSEIKEEENERLTEQLSLLQQLVEERGTLHKLQATTREKEQMDAKMKELRWERRLKDQIKNQDEELEKLRNEIDRLRRRSFPVFAIVQRRRIGGD